MAEHKLLLLLRRRRLLVLVLMLVVVSAKQGRMVRLVGFALCCELQRPGGGVEVKTQQLRFRYEEAFGKLPDAYRTLLEDIVRGDQTLFVHAQEVEAAWRLYAPLLEKAPPVHFYAAGTWGPPEAERLMPNGSVPVPLYA